MSDHECLPGTEHFDVGKGNWADVANDLTQADIDLIDMASVSADFDVKGEFNGALAMARALLVAAPEEWRREHLDQTLGGLRRVLEGYEAMAELALSAPEIRERYAAATLALTTAYGTVFVKRWSFDGDPRDPASWTQLPGKDAAVLKIKAQRKYSTYREELGARLKDAGLI